MSPSNSGNYWTRNSLPKICPTSFQTQKRPPNSYRKPFRIIRILVAGVCNAPKLPDLPFSYILTVRRGYSAGIQ